MICPYCNNIKTKVVDKRETENSQITRRRRECLKCNKRFTTYEKIETPDLIIIKSDGRKEPFNREKLKTGLLKACEKRPISQEKIESTLNKIEAELREKNTNEIPSKIIGNLVIKNLKRLDKVAYMRFASVYRNFADVKDFEKELKLIKK